MKIKRGMHRTVIITRYLTIKFPRVFNPLHWLWHFSRTRDRKAAILDFQNLFVKTPIQGFKENWNEFMCWRDNRAIFLMPVYFCIGVIEIQKTSHQKEISEAEIDKSIDELVVDQTL